ncbi:hypothetical protein L207DRAFT_77233 [Hyaloscypha variabilis F]|uniref:C2H2 type zinc finger domain protein n=1 Tax=Hyaloscypha variabilis (strain UAMH 11265 / GT02V1 / F) TaxID=1149755 RepID=A0A2J6RG69_HYAVF|nr:hypothetical protein L207DRAFT_77233 [Hyaloscypha variabilis F]
MESRQFHCQAENCGRSFTRKEHLTRHERSHNAANLQTCHVCHRKFNRSDSLLRHLAKHGSVFKPNPSGRSKRACITCHAGKTKCDGNEKCSTCLKRGIDCRYRTQDENQPPSPPVEQDHPMDWQGSTSSRSSAKEQEPPGRSSANPTNLGNPAHLPQTPDEPLLEVSIGNDTQQALSLTSSSLFQVPNIHGLVDWSAVKIRTDSAAADASLVLDPNLENRPDSTSATYLELYYAHFHHRWPIVHRPSLAEEPSIGIVFSSMTMIGAWLDGSVEAKKRALDSHETLITDITSQLSKVTAKDKFQHSLPACLCQAALLNIIFGLYTGLQSIVSQTMMLRNTLVAVLRDVGFFDPDSVWVDEKPGFFLPLKLVRVNQRMRLAAYLYKIDTCLGLVRNQPAVLMLEELHYGLQNTYSLWNCDGLLLWEDRQATEPIFRTDKSLYNMISESVSESIIFREYPILIEDIQFYICSIQPSIWKVSDHGEYSSDCEISIVLQKDTLRRRLELLKDRLNLMATQNVDNVEFGQEPYLPYRHYFGYENPSEPGWQNTVTARVKDLLFDTSILYNLFSLYLYADIGTFNKLAKDQTLDALQEVVQRHRHEREQRQFHVRKWIETPTARQALCHAVAILQTHQNQSTIFQAGLTIKQFTLDPMAYAALAVAALVVWTYSMFAKLPCEACFTGSRVIVFHDIELTHWTAFDSQSEKEKEMWIETGADAPAQIHGIELCMCNSDLLTNLFRIYIPPDWELANVIAPGLFD